jgi:hypothetical protein
MDLNWLDWAAAALLGGAVGASELISRYKDHPGAAIKTWPAVFYIAINGIASVLLRREVRARSARLRTGPACPWTRAARARKDSACRPASEDSLEWDSSTTGRVRKPALRQTGFQFSFFDRTLP